MVGTFFLLPVALGDTPWNVCLPAATREVACRLTHFIAENAKSARAELKRLGHPMPLPTVHIAELPRSLSDAQINALLAPLCAGMDVGLVSEAGCPGVADPGAPLVRCAHQMGIQVRPLVGPSALLLALMASGLEGQRFVFHGYLPQREPARSAAIRALEYQSASRHETQIVIETPYRNVALLQALLVTCQARTLLSLASDLTLVSETIATQTIAVWRKQPLPDIDKRPTVFLLLADQKARL